MSGFLVLSREYANMVDRVYIRILFSYSLLTLCETCPELRGLLWPLAVLAKTELLLSGDSRSPSAAEGG